MCRVGDCIWTAHQLELLQTSVAVREPSQLSVQITVIFHPKALLKIKERAVKSPLKSEGLSFLLICFVSLLFA